MTSASFRTSTSLEAFEASHETERREYHEDANPIAVATVMLEDIEVGDVDPDFHEIPASVSEEPVAFSFARMVLEGDPDEVDRCYDVDLYWVMEGNHPKICHYEYMWCD